MAARPPEANSDRHGKTPRALQAAGASVNPRCRCVVAQGIAERSSRDVPGMRSGPPLLEHLDGTNSPGAEPGGGERFGSVAYQRRPAADLPGFVHAALLRAALHSLDSGLRPVSQLLHEFHPARFVPRDGARNSGRATRHVPVSSVPAHAVAADRGRRGQSVRAQDLHRRMFSTSARARMGSRRRRVSFSCR